MNTTDRVHRCVLLLPLAMASIAGAQTVTSDKKPFPDADPSKVMTVTTTAVSAPAGTIVTADDLLAALERTGKDLRTLQADIRWTKEFSDITGGGGDKHTRVGKLMFESIPAPTPDAKPARRFQVDFASEVIDNVQHTKRTTYIFDGQWYVERLPDQQQVSRRQVVPPGQTIDPLAVGEGPFPIPVGQQRSKILERFTAELLPPGDDFKDNAAPQSLQETYQLKLTPKPGSDESKQFQNVRIWYRKTDLLPRMARTTDRDDSKTEVFLTAMVLNQPIAAGAFDTTRPPGWGGDDQNYRRANADE